ncbi:MAG: hypothetical protein JSR41_21830 [Proteobacteria bacterium]|nr:hypothetical protein [Pseudomonadota bacterium]
MQPVAEPVRLEHRFVPGLRFEKELQFVAAGRWGRSVWKPLPAPETPREASGWMALMQARALLFGTMPPPAQIAQLESDVLPALAPGDLLLRAPDLTPDMRVEWQTAAPRIDARLLLDRPNAVRLACLANREGPSWALVVGLEVELRPEAERARALLLLDPRLAAPWATGYNARQLLAKDQWQGLDGEIREAGLLGLIELRRQ